MSNDIPCLIKFSMINKYILNKNITNFNLYIPVFDFSVYKKHYFLKSIVISRRAKEKKHTIN